MENLFVCVVLQLLNSIGAVFFVGFAIAWINKLFYILLGRAGEKVCLATGLIGTPVHEIGHAFFCVLFRHRITEMRLYRPNKSDGTLGYVTHEWDGRSIYQRVGNFFIGTGPIIFGSGTLAVLMWALIPKTFDMFARHLRTFIDAMLTARVEKLPGLIFNVFADFFALANLTDPRWLLYTVLACCIALHLNLSKPDIHGAKPGAVLFAIVVAVPNLALFFFGDKTLDAYNRNFLTVCLFASGVMLLCLFFSTAALAIAFLLERLKKLVKK
ncbi:MAG: hypothetical protein LBT53_04980 [Puniceicoccales bacterium]|nr:hypothetical protein [Puniceicoccales bacterium]